MEINVLTEIPFFGFIPILGVLLFVQFGLRYCLKYKIEPTLLAVRFLGISLF